MTESTPFHVLNSEVHFIKSESIDFEYQLSVVKPASYNDDTDEDYPCLLLLDPGIIQVLIAASSQLLHFSGFPEFITVGVGPVSPHPFGKYSD